MRRKIAAAALALASAVVLFATPAYGVTANVSPTSGPPGTVITISGSGCPGNTRFVRVILTDRQRNAVGHEIDVTGSAAWSTTITVPSTFPAGPYFVDVECRGGLNGGLMDGAAFQFTVTPPTSSSTSSTTSTSSSTSSTTSTTLPTASTSTSLPATDSAARMTQIVCPLLRQLSADPFIGPFIQQFQIAFRCI
jgi:hypothetical protein